MTTATPTPPLDRLTARGILETVGAYGTPPEGGFEHFSVGLDEVLDVLGREYLDDHVALGGAAFKLVVGTYGGGKTHFLYTLRAKGQERGYLVSYVTLSAEESPFHRMDRVYAAVARGLSRVDARGERHKGLRDVLGSWLADREAAWAAEGIRGTELAEARAAAIDEATAGLVDLSFANAVRAALEAKAAEDAERLELAVAWLTAEGYDRHTHRELGILHPVDRSQAFAMLRCLVRLARGLGHTGLLVLFDEAEQVPSLTSKQRELMLSNLRELVDACGHAELAHAMIFYAIPDETVFEGRANVYEALKQRLATVFEFRNPTGVRIRLEDGQMDPVALLEAIGGKLAAIHAVAYGAAAPDPRAGRAMAALASAAYAARFGDIGYKRLFVQAAVRGLQALRHDTDATPDAQWADGLLSGGAP